MAEGSKRYVCPCHHAPVIRQWGLWLCVRTGDPVDPYEAMKATAEVR